MGLLFTVSLFFSTAAPSDDLQRCLADLQSPAKREEASQCLFRVGDPAVRALAALLSSPDADRRRVAAEVLQRFGGDTRVVIPQLIEALDDPLGEVRIYVLMALASDGRDARPAIGKLSKLLRDPNDEVAIRAALALGEIGPESAVAVEDLLRMFREAGDDSDRQLLAMVFSQIGPGAREAEPLLVTTLRTASPDSDLARWAIEALQKIGAQSAAGRKAIADRDNERKRATQAKQRIEKLGGDLDRLIAALKDGDRYTRAAAVEAIASIGTPRDPRFLRALDDPNPYVRVAFAAVVLRGGATERVIDVLADALASRDRALAREALDTLRYTERHAERAIPALVRYINTTPDPLARREAIGFLIALSPWKYPETVPILVEALSMDDHYARNGAAAMLFYFPEAARAATPRLIQLLHDSDASVRRNAARALGPGGCHNPIAVAALANTLDSDDLQLEIQAVNSLQEIGPAACSTVPKLQEAMVTAPPQLRNSIIWALGKLAPTEPQTMRLAAESLRDPDANLRASAAYQLAGKANQSIGEVLELFARSSAEERARMAPQLTWIASLAQEPEVPVARALQIAAAAMDDANRDVRLAGLTVISRFGPAASSAATRVKERLNDDQQIRRLALSVLIGMRDVAALTGAVANEDPYIRRRAIAALRSLRATSELLRFLHSEQPRFRRLAAQTLERGYVDPAAAIPALTTALGDPDGEVVRAAAWSLGSWGEQAVTARVALLRALGSEDLQVRYASARAIRRIDSFALPTLIDALCSSNATVRLGAAEFLATLFDQATDAGDALAVASRDVDPRVRSAAAEALRRTSIALKQEAEMKLVPVSNPSPQLAGSDRLRIDVIIDPDGKIPQPIIREGISPGANSAAVDALSRWTYQPPGAFVAVTLTFGQEER